MTSELTPLEGRLDNQRPIQMGSSVWEYVAAGLRATVVVVIIASVVLAVPYLVAGKIAVVLGSPQSAFWVALPVIAVLSLVACTGAAVLSGTREVTIVDSLVRFSRWDRTVVDVERNRVLRPIVRWRWIRIGVVRYRGRHRPLRLQIITHRQAALLASIPDYSAFEAYDQHFTWWGLKRGPAKR